MTDDQWQHYLGRFSEESVDWEGFEEELRGILAASANDVDTLVLLADVVAARGRDRYHDDRAAATELLNESTRLLSTAIRLAPEWCRQGDTDTAYAKMALNLQLVGDMRGAAEIAAQGLARFPRDYTLGCLRCASLNALDGYEESLRLSQRLLPLCESDPNPDLDIPCVDDEGNEEHLERASVMAALLMVQAYALLGLGRKAEAKLAFGRANDLCATDFDLLEEQRRACDSD